MDELLRRLAQVNMGYTNHKPPKFAGDTDVDLFINNFMDVAKANRWSDTDITLHLRNSLSGPANEAGRGQTPEEIFDYLRGRFGMTARQARDKLDSARRTMKQDLHEYGAEISKLVNAAYPDMSQEFRTRIATEKFQKGLNHPRLQQHLLTRPHSTIPEAVRMAEEFLQFEKTTSVNMLSEEGVLTAPTPIQPDKLDIIIKSLETLIAAQNHFWTQAAQPSRTNQTIGPCFHCGKPGHLRRDCRKLKAEEAQRAAKPSGNDPRPAQ
jgi:hypothetical protein